MKSFTTAEYIDPIITYFMALYTPIKDKKVLEALHCNVLLQSNHSNNAYAIRRDNPFYCSNHITRELYKELSDYAESASTYDGELDGWRYAEQDRIQHTIRDRLIDVFS